MGTRKSVDQILDKAADILEKRGFTTENCYDPSTGGYCALGAIARAVYPKVSDDDINVIAYTIGDDKPCDGSLADPKYTEAVETAARTITRRKTLTQRPTGIVYEYNDSAKSPKTVVKMLRRAAENARKATV